MPLFVIYLSLIFLWFKRQRLLFWAAAGLFLLFALKSEGWRSVVFLRYLLNGVAFGGLVALGLHRPWGLFGIVLLALLPEWLFLTLIQAVPFYERSFSDMMASAFNLINSRIGVPAALPGLEALQRHYLFPLADTVKHVLTTYVLIRVFYRVAGRPKPALHQFAVPGWFIWVFSAGLLLSIVSGAPGAGFAVLASVLCLYILNGIAIVRLFFGRARGFRLGELLFYLVQPGFLFLPLLSIGVLETWLDFRKKISGTNGFNHPKEK
jgi:hypothetical protein